MSYNKTLFFIVVPYVNKLNICGILTAYAAASYLKETAIL